MYATTDYLTLNQMVWLNSNVTRKCYINIKLHLQTKGSDRYIPNKEPCLQGNSGGQGIIPWMKLSWKISQVINKGQRRKSSTSQMLRQTVALLTAYGPQEPIPSSPEGRGKCPHEVRSSKQKEVVP